MMHNNLFLNRLMIRTRDGKIAYDENFHKGINIITGDNSSGKSTISHFIFYVLGGFFNDWVKEAKRCSFVTAEVVMNGAVMTLRREININAETGRGNGLEPISIFWGSMADANSHPLDEWQKYNYNTTSSKKSFSNVFFENLDLPIVQGENNITFNQILRLLYVDQESPTSSLFLYEQFDTTLTRETVSDLLLGVYNQKLYDDKQRKLEAEKEYDDIKKEIKIIKQFIPQELDLYPAHLQEKIANKQKEIVSIENEIIELRDKKRKVNFTKLSKLEFEKLNVDAVAQREVVKDLDSKILTFKYEIEDTKLFIESLVNKVRAIKNSILTRDFLGGFPLDYCPECLSDINKADDISRCKLCKEPIDNSFGVTQAKKIEQELSFQINESKYVNNARERQLMEVSSLYEAEKVQLKLIQTKVNAALNDVRSFAEEKSDKLYEDKGFLEGEIIQLRTLIENAEMYQRLIAKKNELESEIDKLNASIKSMQFEQESKKAMINRAVEKKGLFLLNNDLARQKDFIEAKEFNIDYRNNIAFISDKNAKYSASSNFYLKTSARFAIFLASLEIESMRYPRFILCDNMEDKGIEPKRAHNFQNIIIQETIKNDENSYQMIYTTSHLPSELEDSDYIVGEYYSKEFPSLKNVEN